MIYSERLVKVIVSIAGGVLVGCAAEQKRAPLPHPVLASGPTTAIASTRAGEAGGGTNRADEMKKPFMFGEAKLPKDFPAPGPVGQVILKTYPAARAAVVRSTALGGNADQNNMFMPLFNHIQSHQIAMSAPVEISWSIATTRPSPSTAMAEPTSMAFFYSDPGIGKPGADGVVDVVDAPPLQVVSIGIRGSYDNAHFEAALKQLQTWLVNQNGKYKVVGPPRCLGYNSPFVPWFMRYGEVQLPVVAAHSSTNPR